MDLEKTAEDAEGCELAEKNDEDGREQGAHLMNGSKKEPSVRRYELPVDSGLGESLINTCIENAGELLRSNFGGEVMYELLPYSSSKEAIRARVWDRRMEVPNLGHGGLLVPVVWEEQEVVVVAPAAGSSSTRIAAFSYALNIL